MSQNQAYRYLSLRLLLINGMIFALPHAALAQRIPVADETLGNERSIVSPNEVIRNVLSNRIDGGARRGASLFHSFREFNIDEGRGAYFSNPDGIENILTRVTGNNRSDILGTLGVLGSADLFLINPNGILFGPNARLDVAGSFVSTTADGFVFDNGFTFSTTDPQAPPLLTVSAPIGLQYGSNPGAIQTQGASLQVPDGQTLTLAGGNVKVNGGELLAPGGRIELVGVAAAGEVGLKQQGQEWRLSLPEGLARADIAIKNGANVNVLADGGGSIAIDARNLIVTGARTGFRAGIAAGLENVSVQAGDISITTTEAVTFNASTIENIVNGTGNAGDINVTTGSLSLTNGAYFDTSIYGQGNAGNITITARDTVSFDGEGTYASGAYSGVYGAIGQGGDISITTNRFSLTDGAIVTGIIFGRGNAGTFTLIARDAVLLEDGSVVNQVGSTAIGQGGDINITTGMLSMINGGILSTGTNGRGDAGNITITASNSVSLMLGNEALTAILSGTTDQAVGQGGNISITTGKLSLNSGTGLSTSTSGRGDAGNIIITARDAVSFRGGYYPSLAFSEVEPTAIGQGGDINITTGSLSFTQGSGVSTSTFGQGDAGNITITARDAMSFDGVDRSGFPSGAVSRVEREARGQGGRIIINARLFSITNEGALSASSNGEGKAGDLDVHARQLRLDEGSILTRAASRRGGDMTLQVEDGLLLRQGSSISTTAGTAQTGGDGGNITIDGNFITAVENENSDISANAFTGRGGNVEITTQGIFGIEARPQPTAQSDITASSDRGVAGVITINTPDVDPSRGLIELPVDLSDASQRIAQTCPTGEAAEQNQFVVTGRGGLPPTPSEAAIRDAIQVDLVTVSKAANEDESSVSQAPEQDRPMPSEMPLVEAQGWQVGLDGAIALVAATPSATNPSLNRLVHCR